jgi:sigma-E factor negative regulatory protein RseB
MQVHLQMLAFLFKQAIKNNIMFYRLLFIFLFSLSSVGISYSNEDPWLIIDNAAQATKFLNYKGIFLSQHDKDIKSIEITHAKINNQEFIKMNVLDGSPGEVLSQGKTIYVYNTIENNVIIQKRKQQRLFPAIFPSNIDSIKKFYRLSVGKNERIAGRLSQLVVLSPIDTFRYSHHLWLDKKTSLPLKIIVADQAGNIIEQTSFTQISMIKDESLDWFKPEVDPLKNYIFNDHIVGHGIAKQPFWTIKKIPPGYKEVDFITKRIPGLNILSHQLVFSDGLSYVSLFIKPITRGQKPKVGQLNLGVNNICARYHNGYQIMAVGSVPLTTCNNFSESIEF